MNPEQRKKQIARQQKELARQQRALAKQRLKPDLHTSGPLAFKHNYGQGILISGGPLIGAGWSVPPALVVALMAAGEPVPASVRGVLLLDTGATGTCISQKAAAALGLKATRMATSYGSAGETRNPMFLAELDIPIPQADGTIASLKLAGEVQGIKELEKHAAHLSYAGGPVEVIGLLGRDILRCTRFRYDGIAGSLVIEFDLAAIKSAFQTASPTDTA